MDDKVEMPDELLMALADGELAGNELERVEAYVRSHPVAARRVEDFSRTRDGLARLLNEALVTPVPGPLLDTIMAGSPPAPPPALRSKSVWSSILAVLSSPFHEWPLAASASVLCASAAVGLAFGSHWGSTVELGPSQPSPLVAFGNGHLVAAGSLAAALENGLSGKTLTVSTGAQAANLIPVLTFESKAGGYCRQYTLESPAIGRSALLSCRTASGHWTMEAAAPAGAARAGDQVGVAGAGDIPAVDEAVARLMKGDALSPEQEAGLVASHWTAKRP